MSIAMNQPHSDKIRLMLITHDLALGGLQQVVINICKTIDRTRFEPIVLCLRELGEFTEEITNLGIKVLLLPQKKNGVDYLAFLKVAKILREEKIDVIHTHNTQPFIDGVLGGLLAGVKRMVHTDHARKFPDKFRYMAAEWVLSYFVYKVVAVSEDTAFNLWKYEKISFKKIMVIVNGIYGKSFSISVDAQVKRKELGIDKDALILGVCARLCEQKGITYLLKAMPRIISSFPNCILVIAGTGPMEKPLKTEATALGLNGHIKFIGLRLDVPELLKIFNVYLLPSISEGLPMGLLEAMAAGCPIIATNVGGVETVIADRKTGLLIPPQDPDKIYSAVKDLFENPSLRSTLTHHALQTFHGQFEAGTMTRQYERLYAENFENLKYAGQS